MYFTHVAAIRIRMCVFIWIMDSTHRFSFLTREPKNSNLSKTVFKRRIIVFISIASCSVEFHFRFWSFETIHICGTYTIYNEPDTVHWTNCKCHCLTFLLLLNYPNNSGYDCYRIFIECYRVHCNEIILLLKNCGM